MKKIVALVLAFVLALCGSGCFPTGTTGDGANNADGQNVSNQEDNGGDTQSMNYAVNIGEPLFGEPEKLTKDMIPEHYESDVNGYIKIDAVVTVPEEINFKAIVAKANEFTEPEKIKSIFLGDDAEENTPEDIDAKYYFGDDGARLTFIPSTDGIVVYDRDKEYLKYTNIISGSLVHTEIDPMLAQFCPKTELPGIGREEAVAMVREKIEKLGLDCVDEPDVYCIDSEGARKYVQYIYDNYWRFDDDPDPEEVFGDGDNAYFVVFNIAFDGLPISLEGWTDTVSKFRESEYISAYVDSAGLMHFYAYPGYTVTAEAEIDGMYNVDVVTKALQARYGTDAEMIRSYNVSKICLEYECYNSSGEVTEGLQFQPYWTCYVSTTQDKFTGEETGRPCYVIVKINALTGEILYTSELGDIR